jgi:chemotaxis protein MotB
MSRRRHSHAAAHGNNERWLLTYADMITLLLALFIILFSISTISKVKFKALAHEMAAGFSPADSDELPPEKNAAKDSQSLAALAAALHAYVREHRLSKNVAVRVERRGVVISLRTDSAMFASGSAILEPRAGEVIHALAGFLQTPTQKMRTIKIEGNTDDVPIATSLYPTNWELSTARAVAVTRHLSETDGIAGDRLAAIGFAQWHPIAPNDSEADRDLNRRVDIVVLRMHE